MAIHRYLFPYRFIIICILLSTYCIMSPVHALCREDQRSLLLQLKNDMVFGPESRIYQPPNWNETDDCCSWVGVECDGKGRVIGLQLYGDGHLCEIKNSSSLSQLHFLTVLRLDGYNLSTTNPDFLGNFSRLTTLSLSRCSLKGSFPERVFQVPSLEHLDLSKNVLLCGTIPQFHHVGSIRTLELSFTNFSGTLPDSTNNLTMLSEIHLRNCAFTGPIPSTLTNLTELRYVDLANNNFTGPVPRFYMSKPLSIIDLSNNSLTGFLSSEHFEGLASLFHLDLSLNLLGGSIPQHLFLLPSLQTLIFSNNQFSGRVDEFPTPLSSNLDILDLSSNQLEGPIPESFFKLENLASLILSYNNFNGTVRLHRLQNLVILVLSYNNLSIVTTSTNSSSSNSFPYLSYLMIASCNLYNFPDLIKGSNIHHLDLSNNRITGEVPNWIWEIGNGGLSFLNLSYNLLVDIQKPYNFPLSLHVLDLSSNQLRGELPMPPKEALYVDYSNNKFKKAIPPDIGYFISSLMFLSIANTSLTGPIPRSLCNATGLQLLDLSNNNLTGNLPPCLVEKVEHLAVLSLGRNNISGRIPDSFPINCSLHTLDLSNNNLGGTIPLSLSNCKSLEVLNVRNNNLEDSFPCMQLSSSLHVLVLHSNRFHGEVRCNRNWTNLQIVDIASNNFSGHLYPESFLSWRGMMLDNHARSTPNDLNFDFELFLNNYYHDRVTLTIKGLELQIVKIMRYFTTIDFSSNNFKGEIPDVIGDLRSLYLLNLSHNALTGTIPKSLGKLKQLGSLDLSMNQLTGKIPVELAEPTFLSVLNLSYNQLVGKIPTGSQFQTFSASSFEGNAGLCGFQVNISCSRNDYVSPPPTRLNRKTEIDGDYVSAALGFVVGLGSILWLLWGCQSMRLKFYDLIDRAVAKIFELRDRRERHRRRVLLRGQVRTQ